MPSRKPWLRFADIAENVENVLSYMHGMTLEQFLADQKTIDATERCVLRISEAAVKLDGFAEEMLPHHDWGAIRRIGNVLRHDYDRISRQMIYDTVTRHFERLLADVKALLAAQDAAEK